MWVQQYEVWYNLNEPWNEGFTAKQQCFATAILRLMLKEDDQVERATFDGRIVGAWNAMESKREVQLFVAEPENQRLYRELWIDYEDWVSVDYPVWQLVGNDEYIWRQEGDEAIIRSYGADHQWRSRVVVNSFEFVKLFEPGPAGWLAAQQWCLTRMTIEVDTERSDP